MDRERERERERGRDSTDVDAAASRGLKIGFSLTLQKLKDRAWAYVRIVLECSSDFRSLKMPLNQNVFLNQSLRFTTHI